MNNLITSLYVHIPFCKKICHYCDFSKVYYNEEIAISYIDSLIEEIKLKKLAKNQFTTIYIGGGTPSLLSPDLLNKLLFHLTHLLNVNSQYEFSIEVNPKDISFKFLSIIKKYPINRISLGIQSTDKKTLLFLGRDHNKDDIRFALDMLKGADIKNINADIIYAAPTQNKRKILKDINFLIKNKIPHISFYSLEIHPHTKLFINKKSALSDSKQRKMYDAALKLLRNNNYHRYEVSNFALSNYYCQHNLVYWRAGSYEAIGVSATSFKDNKRIKNTSSINKYINADFSSTIEDLTLASRINEYFMLKLRLEEGINYSDFQNKFNVDFQIFQPAIEQLSDKKLIIADENGVKASDEGIMLLDQVILTFLKYVKEDL